MSSTIIRRIDPSQRSRARGVFAMLRASGVSRHRAYIATVAAYGRPLIRGYYWDLLSPNLRRLLAGWGTI